MDLEYINKDLALKYLNNDLKLYQTVLKSFYDQYKNTNLLHLSNEDFFKQIHQLKSISKNIGAQKLYLLSEDINNNKTRDNEHKIQHTLYNTLNEVHHICEEQITQTKKVLNNKTYNKKELFKQILDGAQKNRPKRVEVPLMKLNSMDTLNEQEKNLVKQIEKELDVYNFKNIIEILI